MASDEVLFDPEITALLAPTSSWLDRLKAIEENRVKLIQDAAESDNESDPDAITIPLGAKLTWFNKSPSRGEKEDANSRMEDAQADDDSAEGDLVESDDELMHDSIVVEDPSPAPRPARALRTGSTPARAAATTTRRTVRQLEMEQPTPTTSSSTPAKRSEIVELSSEKSEVGDSENDNRATSTRKRIVSQGPTKTPTKAAAAASTSARSSPSRASKVAAATRVKGKGRAKARLSLEQAVDQVIKLRKSKLTDPFPTVADLVTHLVQFTSAQPNAKRCLQGCRIVFVNTEHWSSAPSTSAKLPRNSMDEGLRLCLTVAIRHGATLIPPEEFVAPDPSVSPDQLDPDQAEAEGWTTHIVPYVLSRQRLPTYDQILACLGPNEGGISREELGPFVKVVKYDWVASCVDKRAKVPETMYLLGGDFREHAPPLTEQQKRDVKERAQRMKEQAKQVEQDERARVAKKKLRARAGKDALESEDSGSDRGSNAGGEDEAEVVSPLGSQDWPEGEKPPPGYFDHQTASNFGASDSSEAAAAGKHGATRPGEQVGGGGGSADPADEPASGARYKSIPGLEQEVQFLNTYGQQMMDDVLEETPRTAALFELDGMCILDDDYDDDRATDEGTDESFDDEEPAKKKAKVWENPLAGKKKRSVWACDDPEGSVARRNGPNENIAVILEMMADLASSTTEKQQFRQRSYKKIAGMVRKMREIPKEVRHKDLCAVNGIGDKTASKIIEIARTGTHRRLQCLTETELIARELSGVYGIGKAIAEKAAKAGAKSVADLKRDPHKYGLSAATIKGLEHYDDLCERIPRAEVTELYESIKRLSEKIDPKVQIECMGSYRRGAKDSGDIDLLVTRERTSSNSKTHASHIAKLWRAMERAGIAVATLSESDQWHGLDAKVNGLCRLPDRAGAKVRRIDILGVPWEEMPAALIYFTGDDHFNRSIRLKARKHRYRLNQRGLYENVSRDRKGEKLTEGTLVPGIRTERDIFKKLCVPWREPTLRNL
ncbi:hypothetical protein B0A53_00667 [Rhodotorula sp. CCFEE 5036]|nr:hypothetical protein B0A53_00667 [Rhodotorula sp. CCFEE 5036]